MICIMTHIFECYSGKNCSLIFSHHLYGSLDVNLAVKTKCLDLGIFIYNKEGFDCILKRFMIKLFDTDNVDQIMMKKT